MCKPKPAEQPDSHAMIQPELNHCRIKEFCLADPPASPELMFKIHIRGKGQKDNCNNPERRVSHSCFLSHGPHSKLESPFR
jgi:hypothetical protein